jgi:hypothetical protein
MSIKKIDKQKEEITEIQKQRKRLIKLLFSDCELVEGSIRDSLIRCGRPGCHCQKQPIHPVTRLSRWDKGKLKNKIVRVADRKLVKKLSSNYKEHKQALSDLVMINEKERDIIKTVIKLKTIRYE